MSHNHGNVIEAPTPERMIAELEAAGWLAITPGAWRAPSGKLYIGPDHAWAVMRACGG